MISLVIRLRSDRFDRKMYHMNVNIILCMNGGDAELKEILSFAIGRFIYMVSALQTILYFLEIWKKKKNRKNFRSRRWGFSLPGLHTQDPPLSPPSTWAEIFRRTCLQSHFFEISPFSGQNRVILGGRGGPRIIFFYWNPHICVTQEPIQKFEFLRQPLLGF